MEAWKKITGVEGYEVSDCGMVRSLDRTVVHSNGKRFRRKGRILSQALVRGYPRVRLGRDNGHYIARLVAQAFIPNPLNKPQVNHIDGVPTNNHVSNLEWATSSENIQHSYTVLNRASAVARPIKQLTRDGVFISKFKSASDASRAIGGNRSHINECCCGKRKTSDGYKWQFIP